MATAKEQVQTKMTIGPVRFSYAFLYKPRPGKKPGQKAKYTSAILIPKTDAKIVEPVTNLLKILLAQAKQLHGGKLPPGFKKPWKDGDAVDDDGDRVHDDVYAGMFFFNASGDNAPGVLKRIKKDGKIVNVEIEEDRRDKEIYSGMWGYVAVNFYIYGKPGDEFSGIGVGLNHVLKTKDDTRLSGNGSAEDAFNELDIPATELLGSDDDDDLLGGNADEDDLLG